MSRHLVAVVVGTGLLLAACSGGAESPPPSSHAVEPTAVSGSAPASPAASAATGGLPSVFPTQVRLREEGSFGLDRGQELSGQPGEQPELLRVSYPAGSVSPSATRDYGAPEGGMQAYLPLVGGPVDAAYLRYWVRLPAGFSFVKGGKMPGLWGGSEVSGGDEPHGDDGFSTRLMWRADGAGEVYLYAPEESGTSLGRGDWSWPTGRWTCVEEHVVLNDPGRRDGEVTVWLDGRQVYSKTDLLYRTVDSLKIEGIFFSTFFGGDERDWATPRDQYADFASFRIGGTRPGCG